jgi:hypothetical protein
MMTGLRHRRRLGAQAAEPGRQVGAARLEGPNQALTRCILERLCAAQGLIQPPGHRLDRAGPLFPVRGVDGLRGEVRIASGLGERQMQLRRQFAEPPHPAQGLVPALPGVASQVPENPAPTVTLIGNEGLQDGERRGVRLDPAEQRRRRGEMRALGEKAPHLEFGILALLELANHLENGALADPNGRVRLLAREPPDSQCIAARQLRRIKAGGACAAHTGQVIARVDQSHECPHEAVVGQRVAEHTAGVRQPADRGGVRRRKFSLRINRQRQEQTHRPSARRFGGPDGERRGTLRRFDRMQGVQTYRRHSGVLRRIPALPHQVRGQCLRGKGKNGVLVRPSLRLTARCSGHEYSPSCDACRLADVPLRRNQRNPTRACACEAREPRAAPVKKSALRTPVRTVNLGRPAQGRPLVEEVCRSES